MIDGWDRVVLLTGRGGSGTRLLSQLALDAGVFIGNGVSRSGDSIEWIELIYRMVTEVGGRRDLPLGSRYRGDLRATAERVLVAAPPARTGLWGLKLPEAMLVLPLLLDAFPDARVVHLTRHPISSSLRRTHLTSRLGNRVGRVALPAAYAFCGRGVHRIGADEPYLHNANAWNYQVSRVVHYTRDALATGQCLELKYEDVCHDPHGAFETLRSHLGDGVGGATTSVVIDHARTGVVEAHDLRARAVWDVCGRTAELLGYHWDGDE